MSHRIPSAWLPPGLSLKSLSTMVGGTATLLVLALLLLAAAIVGILARPMAAQVDGGGGSGSRKSFENVVRADVYLEYDQLPAGRTCRFAVIFDVQEGWHVNANPPSPDNLIPIQVKFKSKAGLRMVPIDYPEGEETKVDFSPDPAMCHSGRFAVRGILEVPCDAGGQSDEMEIQIKYQTCNDKICLPPKTVKLKAAPQIAVAGAPVRPVNPKLFTPRDDE